MWITLRLYGALRRYRPEGVAGSGAFPLDVVEGMTVGMVVELMGIPPSWVRSAFVNGEVSGRQRVLSSGDQVALFPPTGGG